MSEIPSKLSLDTGASEEITRRLAEEELGSLMQEEVALDAQIEAIKISIEQKRGSNENTDADLQLLEILKEKRGRTAVAIELSAQKHGYEPSVEMGDNTRNVLIDDVFQKQEGGSDVSGVSNMEHDTISHMTTEKPPENPVDATPTETAISYKQSPEDPSMKAADPVVYKTLEGNVIPMKPVEQEPVATAKETPDANNEIGRSFLYDETIVRINKEIGDIKQKAKEATAQLRDHTKDAVEPQKTMEWADKRTSELNKERTEHIKNKIKNASIEEIKAIKDAAHEVVMNQNEMYKTEAVDAIQEADKRIKELETVKHTQQAPELPIVEEMTPEREASAPQAIEINTPTEQIKTEEVVGEKPAEVELKKEVGGEPTPFEKIISGIKSEDPAHAERLLKTIGASLEQKERIEKLLGATETQAQKVEQEIKEKDPWVVERALKIGEWYRGLPLKYKLAWSAVFVGTASVSAALGGVGIGMVMGAAFAGSTGQRILGSLAMFATVEGVLTRRLNERNLDLPPERRDSSGRLIYNNNYEEEEKILGVRMNVVLGALAGSGVFFGGKLLGEYLSTHAGSGTGSGAHEAIVNQTKVSPVMPKNIPNLGAQDMYDAAQKQIHQAIPLPHEAAGETAHSIMTPENEFVGHATTAETASSIMTPHNEIVSHTADRMMEASYHVGSSGHKELWNIIKEKIPEIQDLDGEGRQSNAIANILAKIRLDPESYGISSGNVDELVTGDTIDLNKIHDILKTTTIPIEDGQSVGIIERASELTDVEASHIIDNNAKIAEWHTAHPDTPLTTEVADKIVNNSAEVGTEGTETHADKFENIRKDMETTEAISMKTAEILRAGVQTMFGSKGFFGYGFLGTNGERSIDWLDLKGRTVDEVLSKKFVGVPTGEEGAVQKFGIDSFSAVDKMREYIYMLVEKAGAGTIPEPNESVEHFSKRAINVIISKK